MNLQDVYGVRRRISLFHMVGAGQAGYRRDGIGMVISHAERHEATVGVANQVDAVFVHVVALFHLVDDGTDVGAVIDFAAVEVAASRRGVPEAALIATGFTRAIGCHEQETVVIGQRAHPEVAVLPLAAGGVTVQQDDEWHGGCAIVGIGNGDGDFAAAEVQSGLGKTCTGPEQGEKK